MLDNKGSITRRSLLKLGAAGVAVAVGYPAFRLLTGAAGCSSDTASHTSRPTLPRLVGIQGFSEPRPNVVIILSDDLGSGDTGCYGNRIIRTPNINDLAQQGVRFTDFYASASTCTPSRMGLLTGRYPIRSGCTVPIPSSSRPFLKKYYLDPAGKYLGRAGLWDMLESSLAEGIPDDEMTLADALKVAGYRTMAVGKWHLGDFSRDPQYHPMRHGFDEFFGTPMSLGEYPNPLYRDETMLEKNIGLNVARLTELSTAEAVKFIERTGRDAPFFLYLAYHAPHVPLFATARFKDKSSAGIYGDVVEELDWGIGEVMQCLRRNGLQDNTIVMFTSDNGPWYDGKTIPGLRGRKGQSFEGGYRVPFIARWPGRIKPGTVCDTAAMNIDIFPTLLAQAGLTPPSDRIIDGRDIIGLMNGKDTSCQHDKFFFYEAHICQGVRAGDWKYFRDISHYRWPFPVDRPTTFIGSMVNHKYMATWPDLYNIRLDEGEDYNLSSRYPDKCREMDALLTAWENELRTNPRGWINLS